MKQNLRTLFTSIVVFSLFSTAHSQVAVPFKVRYQSFVKGDMTVIANSITNRVDYNNSANAAYYNHTNHAKLNDEFTMQYIDIDEDETTFSSSSATLSLENQSQKKIVYAGLYWSSTYKYNSGYQKKVDKFVAEDDAREPFETIKLKLPNQKKYIDVNGELLFDGLKEKDFKDCSPYAVYADITAQIQAIENPFGEYTVANVRATQGQISGGVAAGWTLFVVYEDDTMKGKFITSFDGFAGVTDRQVDIDFAGFTTLPEGDIQAKIALASLEGDCNLQGDQVLFKSSDAQNFVILENKLRKQNNFFNSSITIGDDYFMNRKPDSKNTLGYDTCLMNLNNPYNSVIANNVKNATFRLKSIGDRSYLFFAAFGVEVNEKEHFTNNNAIVFSSNEIKETPKKEVKPEQKPTSKSKDKKKPIKKEKDEIVYSDLDMTEFVVEKKKLDFSTTILEDSELEIAFFNSKNSTEIKSLNIDGFPSGYYIIANVFEKDYNLNNFLSELQSKGISADSFLNPNNHYNYVYLAKTADKSEAFDLYKSKLNNSYTENIWILSVNNNQDSAITNLDD